MKFLFPGENTSTSVYFAVTCHSISSGGGVMNSRAFNMADRCHSHHPRRQKVELPELFDGRKLLFITSLSCIAKPNCVASTVESWYSDMALGKYCMQHFFQVEVN